MTGFPLVKIELTAGVRKDNSALDTEGGYVDADKVRSRRGRFEVIGGWEKLDPDLAAFEGVARGAKAWQTLDGVRVFAFGTTSKAYAYIGGQLLDITPPHSEGVLTDPFTTTAGSAVVTVTLANHRLRSAQSITFSHAATVSGLDLNGTFAVLAVISVDTFTITAASGTAAGAVTGGGNIDYSAALPDGLTSSLGGLGYGVGTYGVGTYGTPRTGELLARVWSLANFGENLLACPRGFGLYEFQPELAYLNLVTNGDFATTSTGWALGTGWSWSAGTLVAVAGSASNASQNLSTSLEGGRTYRVTFDVVRTAGTVAFKVNAGETPTVQSVGDASTSINTSGSYSRIFRCPAYPVDVVFAKDATFAGSIDNVTVKLESKLYRIDEAPLTNGSMFTDPHGHVVMVGSEDEAGTYNPSLIRWSGQQNNRQWLADVDNLAGSYPVAFGGRAIRGVAGKQQNLILTDESAHVMQYLGNSGAVFGFQLAAPACGLIGANAIVEAPGTAMWMGNNGQFYSFDGATVQAIPCDLLADVFDNLSENQGEKVYGFNNAGFTEAWWSYPDARDGTGECSRYVMFNVAEGHWHPGTFDRTSWIDPTVFPEPIAFSSDGYIYKHEKGNDADGNALAWYIESGFLDIEDGDRIMAVHGWVPDFERQLGPVQFTATGRLWPSETTESERGPYTHGLTNKKPIYFRLKARQIKFRWEGSSSPAFVRQGVQRIYAAPTAARR